MASTYRSIESNEEPTLDEMFAEPIVQLVMQRDGVNAFDMRSELSRMLTAYSVQAA